MAIIANSLNPDSNFLGGHVKERGGYVHKEYPKWVYPDGWLPNHPEKGGKLVQNAQEEATVMGDKYDPDNKWPVYLKAPPVVVAPDSGEKTFLLGVLKKLKAELRGDETVEDLRIMLDLLAEAPEPVKIEPVKEDHPSDHIE